MQRLFRPTDIASLVFFRIAFGILGLADVFNSWVYYQLMTQAYEPDGFQFRYYGFEWVRPLPEPFMSIALLGTCAFAVLVILGKWYRLSATLFAFGFAYTYFLEKAHYLNHAYLFCWLSFLMIFLPAHRAFSLDARRRPELRRETIPFWPLFLLRFLMGLVYFYGGIAKLNADWLRAIPLKQWLANKADTPVLGPLLAQEWMAYFMAYGGLLLDLTVAFFLLSRRTRPWAFAAVIFFHVMNFFVFHIGIFPFLSVALTALFFPPDFPRRILAWWAERSVLFRQWRQRWAARADQGPAIHTPAWEEQPRWRPVITAAIVALCALHLLLPWRHHFFPGDVTWTEEGHRYSWRMMLRSKQGYGHFILRDAATGEEEKVYPRDLLDRKQERKLYTHPDMILQFAHHLRDEYQAQGREVEVYARIRVKLNFREYCDYIDPETDLAQERWRFFKPSPWILPEVR
jgi:vitamin K-dependent gamma-carboxylase